MALEPAIRASYEAALRRKAVFLPVTFFVLAFLVLYAVAVGSYGLGMRDVLRTLFGLGKEPMKLVIWNIRLPRILSAVIGGTGLALSGVAFQCFLKNPLASASTLGISHGAAALGAAFAIVVLGAGGFQGSALRTNVARQLNLQNIYKIGHS